MIMRCGKGMIMITVETFRQVGKGSLHFSFLLFPSLITLIAMMSVMIKENANDDSGDNDDIHCKENSDDDRVVVIIMMMKRRRRNETIIIMITMIAMMISLIMIEW